MYRRLAKTKYLIGASLIFAILVVNNIMSGKQVSNTRRFFIMPTRGTVSTDPRITLNSTIIRTKRPVENLKGTNNEYERRRNVGFNACLDKKPSDWLDSWPRVKAEPKFRNSPMISTKRNLLYCPVGKVASSFFTRWVLSMNKPGPMKSPYTVAMKDAGRGRAESLDRLSSDQTKMEILNFSTRVVFGRNPYSRIFSAWIDKLFSPNPFYWRRWGDVAVRLDNSTTRKKNRCYSHVTFSQFVTAVTRNLSVDDVHLIPVSVECNVCQMSYDVIGKLENTAKDLDYASTLLNISSSFQHESQYKTVAEKDMVFDSVYSGFISRSQVRMCGLSTHEMGLRIWRKFQIRGVIDRSVKYPFMPGALDRMRHTDFIKASEDAILKSTDKGRLKNQKSLAMQVAYSSLPNQLIEEIQKVYDLEFAFFDYEKHPDYLFKDVGGQTKYNEIFQVEKAWI